MLARASASLLALAVLLVTAVAVAAPGQTGRISAKKITGEGVGGVKLGRKHATLKEKGLVGKLGPGCELAGPGPKAARLKKPLEGHVDLATGSARRVTNITILGGATARGVGIGDTKADVKAAYPEVKFDSQYKEMFGIIVAKVPKSDGGKLEIALDSRDKDVRSINVPEITFCE